MFADSKFILNFIVWEIALIIIGRKLLMMIAWFIYEQKLKAQNKQRMLITPLLSNTILYTQTKLCKKLQYKIIKRYMIAAGTKISVAEKIAAQKIAKLHNSALHKQIDKSPDEFLTMVEQTLHIQPKIAQHILTTLYPKKTIPLEVFEKRYPNISLVNKNFISKADLNDTIASVEAARLKGYAFYKHTKLNVLLNPDKHSTKYNEIAYNQTGQKNPDYFVNYEDKWVRYQDLKTGQYNPNTGHVYISNVIDCEYRIKLLLFAQREYYRNNLIIKKALGNIILDETLSWRERNEKVQEFYKTILQKYPEVNPSLIFESKPNYDLDAIKIPKVYETTIQKSSCFSDIPSSESTMGITLLAGGKKTIMRYMEDPYANANIVAIIKENLSSITEEP